MKKLAVFAGLLISGMIVPVSHAGVWCSVSNLQGEYSFVATGTLFPASGLPAGPFAAAGKTTYDGEGNASGVIQISLSGTMLYSTWHGPYKVDSATCTVTKAITLDVNGVTLHFFITAGNDFRELRFIATDPGTAITGTATKQ